RHLSGRHGERALRARRRGEGPRRGWTGASDPDRRVSPSAGRHAGNRYEPPAWRAHRGHRAAQVQLREEFLLSEGPRPRLLRLRARRGRRRPGARRWPQRWQDSAGARRPRRRGPQAVAKVTGKAKYAAEFQVPGLAYGFIVQGAIAKGTIRSIDTREAEAAGGVVRVFTHLNAPKLGRKASTEEAPPRGNQEEKDKSF